MTPSLSAKPLPLSDLTQPPPSTPTEARHPASTLPRPRMAENEPSHPTPTWPSPCPPWTPRQSQQATVHPTPCHLAARTPSKPRINSPRRFHLSPTVRRDPTVPARRQRAAGSAQSGHRVATCTRPHPRRPAPKPTQHDAVDPLPPSPCPLAACTDPGEPGFSHARSEPEAAPTGPLRH
jgi:hypothetical protein